MAVSWFTPLDWYWTIGGSTTQVFSSARCAYVSIDSDLGYGAFVAAGKSATPIPTPAQLVEVLSRLYVPRVLLSVALTSTGTPSLSATYPLDPVSQQQISSISTGIAAGKGLPGGGETFVYNRVTFTGDQFLTVASALESYVYNFSAALTTIVMSGSGNMPTVPISIP